MSRYIGIDVKEPETICDDANCPNCDIIKILDNKVNTQPAASNFVSLCRKEATETKVYDKCDLALLMVSAEEKRT